MDRIFVDGVLIDTYDRDSINFNVSINKLGNITNRNSSYSTTFTIPRTALNESIFGFAGVAGNTSDVPYELKACRYEMDTTPIIVNGKIKLIEATDKDYRVVLFDGIIDLTTILGDSTIKDLDWSEYDHYGDVPSVSATFGNTTGMIYAIGEFGKEIQSTEVQVNKLAPSLFVRTVWEKIWSTAGLSYTGDFFTDNADWKELVLTPTTGEDIADNEASYTDNGTSSTDTINRSDSYGVFTAPIYYDHEITVDNYDNATLSAGDIIMSVTDEVRLTITTTYTETDTDVWVRVLQNGVVKKTQKVTDVASGGVWTLNLSVVPTDVIKLQAAGQRRIASYPPPDFDVTFTTESDVQIETLGTGDLLLMDNYITNNLKQIDFVKDIVQRYGLILVRDKHDSTLYNFIQMEDLLTDRTNSVDWTDKLISIDSEQYVSGYAQLNIGDYVYANDDEVETQIGRLTVVNANAPVKQTMWTSVYTIPRISEGLTPSGVPVRAINGQPLYQFKVWAEDDDEVNGYSLETAAPSIMRILYDNDNLNLKYFSGANTLVTDPIPFLSLTEMSYQWFFDEYFTAFETLLGSYKSIDVEVDLDLIDLHNLDLTKLIHLRQTGRHYYIDSIRMTSKGSTAKLIEIRNFIA